MSGVSRQAYPRTLTSATINVLFASLRRPIGRVIKHKIPKVICFCFHKSKNFKFSFGSQFRCYQSRKELVFLFPDKSKKHLNCKYRQINHKTLIFFIIFPNLILIAGKSSVPALDIQTSLKVSHIVHPALI